MAKSNIRELPAYSIKEAAHYLSVSESTMRYWAAGQNHHKSLIDAAQLKPVVLLSFFNLTELHVLATIRKIHEVPMHKVRVAIDFLQNITTSAHGKRHPLISQDLQTNGLDLFIQEMGRLINISEGGQEAIKEVVKAALKRIERDDHGIPIRLFPFTRQDIYASPSLVVIDPALSAGRPVIRGTGLSTQVIAERYKAGDSVKELAKDYERKTEEIEEAIRCELQLAA